LWGGRRRLHFFEQCARVYFRNFYEWKQIISEGIDLVASLLQLFIGGSARDVDQPNLPKKNHSDLGTPFQTFLLESRRW